MRIICQIFVTGNILGIQELILKIYYRMPAQILYHLFLIVSKIYLKVTITIFRHAYSMITCRNRKKAHIFSRKTMIWKRVLSMRIGMLRTSIVILWKIWNWRKVMDNLILVEKTAKKISCELSVNAIGMH